MTICLTVVTARAPWLSGVPLKDSLKRPRRPTRTVAGTPDRSSLGRTGSSGPPPVPPPPPPPPPPADAGVAHTSPESGPTPDPLWAWTL